MQSIGTMLRALLIPLGALMAAGAWADDATSRWSFGTQLGQARGTIDSTQWTGAPSTLSYDVAATWGDEDRFGWRVFTGYQFTDYLAVHVGYTDLGKMHSRLVDEAGDDRFSQSAGKVTQTVRGVDVGLQVKVPLSERIAVAFRGGKYYWKSRTRAAAPWLAADPSTRRDSDHFLGAGVEVGVIDDLSASLGWTRYEVAGEPIHLWTVGVLYGFNYF